MYNTSSKLNEIILLNRKLRNALSFRGGSTRKLYDFKSKLIENKLSILYLYISSFIIGLYLFYISLPKKKQFMGGGNSITYDSFLDILDKNKKKFNEIISIVYKNISNLHDAVLKMTKVTGGPVIVATNMGLGLLNSTINIFLWRTPCIPILTPVILILLTGIIIMPLYSIFLVPILALVIVIVLLTAAMPLLPILYIVILTLILIYFICMCLIDGKIYIACYGCDTDTSLYKCIPGTGKGSVSCTIYTEFLEKIRNVLKSISGLKTIISNFKRDIVDTFNKIISFIFLFDDLFYKIIGSSITTIFDKLRFLKHLEIPDEWGFNFGKFIICKDNSMEGLDCIYNKDGTLRSRHGSNPIFHTFWKMIRIILELPPPIPKFPLGGGINDCDNQSNEVSLNLPSSQNLKPLKLAKTKVPRIIEPTIETHTVDTTVKSTADKNEFDKNIAYKKLLESLIKIEINPIKWIAALFNLVIDFITFIIEKNIDILKKIIIFITGLITELIKGMLGVFNKIINLILKPLNEVANIVLKLPKQLFKTISKILDIGIFTIITSYFHNMLLSTFPFLSRLRSFMVIITICIIIQTVLILCPIIGGLYAFYTPCRYIYKIYVTIENIIKNQNIFNVLTTTIVNNNKEITKIIDYLTNLNDFGKIILITIIVILIIFILLNLFTDFNRRFTKYIIITATELIYGHYYNKFNKVHKKFIKFKIDREKSNEKK